MSSGDERRQLLHGRALHAYDAIGGTETDTYRSRRFTEALTELRRERFVL